MHPYGHHGYHWHHFHRRGPRRFVWFLIGAGAATWFIKHKEEQRRLGYDGGAGFWGPWAPWAHCGQRQAIQAGPQSPDHPQAAAPQQPYQQPHHWGWGREQWMNRSQAAPQAPAPVPAPAAVPAPPAPVAATVAVVAEPVNEKAQPQPQFQPQPQANVGQQAGDKLVELSEATLDTVLTTVEVLKAKLAEHRAEREKAREGEKSNGSAPRLV